MIEKKSILGNIIKYDEDTLYLDIDEILSSRFSHGELSKTLKDLYNPFLLKDMDLAVNRIKKSFKNKERVMIFGDYDVDGVTSTSILMHFFKKIGLQASYRLPDRKKDGYGLKKYFIDEIASLGVKLLITVDCGIKDYELVEYAKELGLDVIITDHHNVPEKIPTALAVINPKRDDCEYPFKGLAGVGVAFKLISALIGNFIENKAEQEKYLEETLDIVALGTVADCMELVDENRIIVKYGLEQLKKSRSKGIYKLIEEKLEYDLDADVFGFLIGPRINAAGRLSTPYKAVDLILNNSNTIDETIYEIEQLNEKRKKISLDFFEDALNKINIEDNILFYGNAEIEHGIIGIISGRITQQYFKPSIVYKIEEDKIVASCRSPYFFSISDYLNKYKNYFLHFGGHHQAAGFSISLDKFEKFKQKFTQEINSLDFSDKHSYLEVNKILNPYDFGFNFLDNVMKFKPFGSGNLKPIFMFKDFEFTEICYLGKGIDHITIKNKYGINILGFNLGQYYKEIKSSKKIDIIFELMEDYWMGKRQLKAKIIDIII